MSPQRPPMLGATVLQPGYAIPEVTDLTLGAGSVWAGEPLPGAGIDWTDPTVRAELFWAIVQTAAASVLGDLGDDVSIGVVETGSLAGVTDAPSAGFETVSFGEFA